MKNNIRVFTSKIGQKGLMTLPKGIRSELGINEGYHVLFKLMPDGKVILEKAVLLPANDVRLTS